MSGRIVRGREAVRARTYEAVELRRQLLAGDTVHFPDERLHYNRKAIRERHGRVLRWRSDGKGGRYWWTEPAS